MRFDSHVFALISTSVRLVNALSAGSDGGRPVRRPEGVALVEAVSDALDGQGGVTRVSTEDAERLDGVVQQVRPVFDAVARGDLDAAAEQVNALLRATEARPRLDKFGDGGWSLHFHGPDVTVSRADVCQCHHLRQCRVNTMCLLDIGVDEVVHAVERRLATESRGV